jgi:hypothetical protein
VVSAQILGNQRIEILFAWFLAVTFSVHTRLPFVE